MRLIDADKLVKKWEEMLPIMVPDEDGKHPVSLEKAIEKLKDAQTIDAVPVVRCKDCYHFDEFDCPDGWGICRLHDDSEWNGNDHCSYGCEYGGDSNAVD